VGKEREKKEVQLAAKIRGGGWFFVDFGPKSLPPQPMKIKYIYKGWKRDTLSLVVSNLSLWFDPKASQPLVQSSNDELSVFYKKMSGQVGHFGVASSPLNPRLARTIHSFILTCSQVSGDR
jgi:hypothetical protein